MTSDESPPVPDTETRVSAQEPSSVSPASPANVSPTKGSSTNGHRKAKPARGAGQAAGLVLGSGATNQARIDYDVQVFGLALRRAVVAMNGGPTSILQEGLISTARTHERRARYAERWLRNSEEKTADDANDLKLSLAATISTAREARDRTLEKLFGSSAGGNGSHDPFEQAIAAADAARLAPQSTQTTTDESGVIPAATTHHEASQAP